MLSALNLELAGKKNLDDRAKKPAGAQKKIAARVVVAPEG